MSAGILYLNENQVVEIHRKTVEVSGGGALGVLRINDLFGVLEHLKNDDYYPSFSEKIAHLFFCACKFHGFQDGNKRIAHSYHPVHSDAPSKWLSLLRE